MLPAGTGLLLSYVSAVLMIDDSKADPNVEDGDDLDDLAELQVNRHCRILTVCCASCASSY